MGPALRAKESCSDVVQSVCREVLDKLDRYEYRGAASFRHWLYRAALNKIIDHQRYWLAERRSPRREQPFDDAAHDLRDRYATISTPSREAMNVEDVERIESAFDRLPEHYREVIVLSRIVGLPHREIARQMDRSEEATRTMLRRALVRLSGLLEADGA